MAAPVQAYVFPGKGHKLGDSAEQRATNNGRTVSVSASAPSASQTAATGQASFAERPKTSASSRLPPAPSAQRQQAAPQQQAGALPAAPRQAPSASRQVVRVDRGAPRPGCMNEMLSYVPVIGSLFYWYNTNEINEYMSIHGRSIEALTIKKGHEYRHKCSIIALVVLLVISAFTGGSLFVLIGLLAAGYGLYRACKNEDLVKNELRTLQRTAPR